MRRDLYADNAEVKTLLEKGDALVNLTQNVDFVNYSSNFCPCLLTKSFVWSLRQGRQLLWQELFNAQGVPMLPDSIQAAQLGVCPINADLNVVRGTRLAGNGFHIACAGSCVGFILSQLRPRS